MSLTAISLLKSRLKFYINLTHAIKLFWAQKAEMILIEKKIFHELDVQDMSRK